MLRLSHVFDSVKDRKLPFLVRKFLREDVNPDPALDTETALGYAKAAAENDALPTQNVSEVYQKALTDVDLESGDT